MASSRLRRTIADVATSSLITGLVTVALAYESLLPEKQRDGRIIAIAFAAGAVDAAAGFVMVRRARERARMDGLIRENLGQLTLNLAALATDRPQDWAAELLLLRGRARFHSGPLRRRLERVVFHRLGAGPILPEATTTRSEGPAFECVRASSDVIWSVLSLAGGSENFNSRCHRDIESALSGATSACRCALVADRDERSVLGVLVVYLLAEMPEKLVGTMETTRFAELQRQCARAVGRLILES